MFLLGVLGFLPPVILLSRWRGLPRSQFSFSLMVARLDFRRSLESGLCSFPGGARAHFLNSGW